MPVRERLLLVLPDKEIFDYLCTGCASSVGQREVTAGEKVMAQARPTPPDAGFPLSRQHTKRAACASSLSARAKLACRLCGALHGVEDDQFVGRRNPAGQAGGARPDESRPRPSRARSREPIPILCSRRASKTPRRDRADSPRSQPDVIVVMAYGQILPRALLEIPKIACLNLHASLLPRWRGAAPIQAAIAAGDPRTGMTIMYMAEGLDTGDILLQHKIEIAPDETGGSLHDRLAEVASGRPASKRSICCRKEPRRASRRTNAPRPTRQN